MKTIIPKYLTTSLLLVLLGGGPAALAQPQPGGAPVPPGREGAGPGVRAGFAGQPPGPGRFSPALERILGILTEEQHLSFRDAMERQRDRVRAVEERLVLARRDLLSAALEERFDERKVREIADGTAKLEADLSVLFLRALSRVRPPLTPGQIEKAKGPPTAGVGQPPVGPQRQRPDAPPDAPPPPPPTPNDAPARPDRP